MSNMSNRVLFSLFLILAIVSLFAGFAVADDEPAPRLETVEVPGADLKSLTPEAPSLNLTSPIVTVIPACNAQCIAWYEACQQALSTASAVCRDARLECAVCCAETGSPSWPSGVPR